ncbi:LuxR C-terminal-related transcriptional regulator [Nocardia cyriacigeorgica]|uniref:LuxR C-terminal-related transcriptional regulator n=1 Tax=Nocardia cyriacigeorgica TaxID=135487 RepID=UPI0028038766|nr:LuxR C-terminal-related transcriptional regulator [Nocardia cyriacigeorgica]
MPRAASTTRAVHDLVRHCHGGLDPLELPQQLLRSVRRLLPVDAAFFATADPATLLFTGSYAEQPLDSVAPLFLDNEFSGNDVNRFAALALSPTHVASLDAATHFDRAASGRYRDIMRPLGLGDELRAALVAGSHCWGYLCLHRADDPLGFTRAETELIASVGPHLAHALRRAVLLTGSAAGAADEPGVVLLAENLSVVAVTPEAEHLLSLVEQLRPSSLPLPAPAYAVAMALRSIEQGTALPQTLPTSRVRARDGRWLTLYASRLSGPPGEQSISVVIKTAEPATTVPLLLSAYGLSPREAEVARLVLRGSSTQHISESLHISRHTVQDHLKAVFDKVGVRSRRDLVGVLLRPPAPAPGDGSTT